MRRWLPLLLMSSLLAGCASDEPPVSVDSDGDGFPDDEEVQAGSDPDDPVSTPPKKAMGLDDAVVIAVVDSGINPYHFDYRADRMPQWTNNDPTDDLPLWSDPASWLPGHPGADGFASYGELALNLSTDEEADGNALYAADEDAWSDMQSSSGGDVHMRWIPGTKIIGLVSFSGDGFSAGSHGGGSASVSTGTLHGTCPECLLVFVNGLSNTANDWVAKQDWIDLQTNSWGGSSSGVARDRIYTACDTQQQKEAAERGQQTFFSAGNGLMNTFTATNPTLFSCQEGPDWMVTVGAIHPSDGSSYSGHGKPADVAAPGGGYPSAYCSQSISCVGSFGGTSNATPVTAGLYGKALYELRRAMDGASRIQQDGVVSVGAYDCDCPIGDGELTIKELRAALFDGSQYTPAQWSVSGNEAPIATEEMTYMAEGHGSFYGRLQGDTQYELEWNRIVGAANGTHERSYPSDALDWFASLSYCTQEAWGTWAYGEHNATASLPDPRPDRPMTAWLQTACPTTVQTVISAF